MTGTSRPKRSNGWSKSELYVMKKLAELQEGQNAQTVLIQSLRSDVLILKVKAGVWGLIGAAIPTIGAILFILLNK